MTPERWSQVKQALAAALAQAPEQRVAYVSALGQSDPELGREVQDLLVHHVEEEFLEQPAVPGRPAFGSSLDPGAVFGSYQIQSPLGEGGMGIVYLAQDRALDRPVALKFLSATLQQQAEARRRFLHEAKAAAALDHPYVCKIYNTGEEDGRPFIAMEYVRGETLRCRLDRAPMSVRDILGVCVEVAEALETAHAAQIVHRDLKPSNIMLTTGGHVKVLDFGLAKRIGEEDGVHASTRTRARAAETTDTGTVHGTVAYMSPEQVRGSDIDVRSDIFSLGVVLYEGLTGKHPFQAGSMLETASQILHHTPPAPGLARGDVPAALEQVVFTMLAKAPEARYQSAHDLRPELARIKDLVDRRELSGHVTQHVDPSSQKFSVRRRFMGALAAMIVAGVGISVWWATRAPTGAAASRGALSVAVLPFANVSGDAQNDYLANGITQAVTTRLSRAGLRVIPWETARRFRDSRGATAVARELGVDAVLTGSFQTDRDRLRVTVSLIEGATGFISWTDEFEERFEDIFQVQTRIAQGVATNLGHELTGEAAAKLARTESSSTDAYDFYLQGAEYLQDGDRESTDLAYEFFARAVKIDANLTEAHVGLGAVYLERFWNAWGGGVQNLDWAEKSFRTALQRDATNMRAQRGLNHVAWDRGRTESHLEFARDAARLGVDDIETLLARGEVYTTDGPEDLAVPILERVLALDPWNQAAAWHFTTAYHNLARFEDAVKAADNYVRRFGPDSFIDMLAANALERLGDVEAARDRYDRAAEPVMQVVPGVGSATTFDLSELLVAGAFHSRHGQHARAEVLWQRGLRLAGVALANDPGSVGMHLNLASFLAVLGDRTAAAKEEAAALARAEEADLNPWELRHLAIAYAHVGDPSRAMEVLRYALRRGRLFGRPWLMAPGLERADGFADLAREYHDATERRRRLYSPAT